MEILNFFIESSEHSFVEIISLVGFVIFLFEISDIFNKKRVIGLIERSKNFQPILGALLGLIPGCAGSLVIMPLYIKGSIGFGAIVATLISTLGDSAFVLLTSRPMDFIKISIISFITGTIIGYLVDFSGLGDRLYNDYLRQEKSYEEKQEKFQVKEYDFSLKYRLVYNILFLNIFIGLIFFILHIFKLEIIPEFIVVSISTISMLLIFIVRILNKGEFRVYKIDSPLQRMIFNIVNEIAFIGIWVFMAFFLYDVAIILLGSGNYLAGEELVANFMLNKGFLTIIIAGIVGMIPGCGPQIIFVSLYIKGLIPFSALLANSISQDGDALFPLIAAHKKSAVVSTIINLLPSLILGSIFYILENM